jgi:hypothetical protein
MGENIKIEIGMDKIREALKIATDEIFKSSYNNPIKDLIEKSIKEKEGEIKSIVDSIIIQAIGDPEFKTQMADAVITSLVKRALDK